MDPMHRLPPFKIPAACGTLGILDRSGHRFNGADIMRGMANMHERGNGLGAGYVAYGIYPEHADDYCLHMMLLDEAARDRAREYLSSVCDISHDEPIPTRRTPTITDEPVLWRFFVQPRADRVADRNGGDEQDFLVDAIMTINRDVDGAYVASSGKNMGIFKGWGTPSDRQRTYPLRIRRPPVGFPHPVSHQYRGLVGWGPSFRPAGVVDCPQRRAIVLRCEQALREVLRVRVHVVHRLGGHQLHAGSAVPAAQAGDRDGGAGHGGAGVGRGGPDRGPGASEHADDHAHRVCGGPAQWAVRGHRRSRWRDGRPQRPAEAAPAAAAPRAPEPTYIAARSRPSGPWTQARHLLAIDAGKPCQFTLDAALAAPVAGPEPARVAAVCGVTAVHCGR